MENVQSPVQNQVGSAFIHVSDLRPAAEWYSMVMGLPLLEERLNGGNVYWLELENGTGIILDDNKSNAPDAPHVLFNYVTEDIDAAYRYVGEQGPRILYPIERPHPGLAYFNFTDPDGNALMVVQSDYTSPTVPRVDGIDSPILNKISSMFINVTDLDRAVKFHSKILGVSCEEAGHEASIYELKMKSGSGVLLDNNRFRQGDCYHTLLMLAAKDTEGARAYLRTNGVEPFTDIEQHGDISFFTVKDPDGNVIMICKE